MVDDEDFEWLNQWKWRLETYILKSRIIYYAIRSSPRVNGKWHKIWMHREILGIKDSLQGDHKDDNGLNNQRFNLRKATIAQNAQNRVKQKKCSSRFKGVYWNRQHQKWVSHIQSKNCYQYLGVFSNEIDAAMAYDTAARKTFGQFAKVNIPNNITTN